MLSSVANATPLELTFTRDVLYELTSDSENKKTQQIIESIKASNPRMEALTVLREGDEITLSISSFSNFGKATFRLVGNKHDFYRMAMGVNLDHTLELITKADKNVEPAGSDKTKETVLLKLNYLASDLVGKPSVVASKPETPAPTKSKVTQSAAAKQIEEVETAFAKAQKSNDPKALSAFADKYPESPKAEQAQLMADKLREDAAYERATKDDSLRSYRAFLEFFPKSSRRGEVEKRIGTITAAAKTKAKQAQKNATEKEISDAYAKAGSVEALKQFISKYPSSPQATEAGKRIKAIQKDDDAFKRSRHSTRGLTDYLKAYPSGLHASEAKRRLEELKAQEKKKQTATRKANAQKKKAAAAAAAAKKPPAQAYADSIVAHSTSNAPTVDGKPSDAVWKNATPMRISLKTEKKVSAATTVEVRALHSDGVIYLLAQWKDPTVDRQFRPWSWDTKINNYQRADTTLDDGFGVAIHLDPNDREACMLRGGNHETDLWVWRAFWSDISGYASDQLLLASSKPLRRANSYVNKSGQQVWIQNRPDKGTRAWVPEVPPSGKNIGNLIPSYIRSSPLGSAGDVRAKGSWVNGMWTVEMARALDTGNSDDAPIPSNGKIMVSFSIYDRADKDNHTASALVPLETKGR